MAGDRWQPINQLEKQCWRRVGDAPSVFSAPLCGGGEILTECGERGVVACPHVTPYMCNALPRRCVVDVGGCNAFGGLRPCAAVGFDMLGFPALTPLTRQTETVTRVKASAIDAPGTGTPVATCPATHPVAMHDAAAIRPPCTYGFECQDTTGATACPDQAIGGHDDLVSVSYTHLTLPTT